MLRAGPSGIYSAQMVVQTCLWVQTSVPETRWAPQKPPSQTTRQLELAGGATKAASDAARASDSAIRRDVRIMGNPFSEGDPPRLEERPQNGVPAGDGGAPRERATLARHTFHWPGF